MDVALFQMATPTAMPNVSIIPPLPLHSMYILLFPDPFFKTRDLQINLQIGWV